MEENKHWTVVATFTMEADDLDDATQAWLDYGPPLAEEGGIVLVDSDFFEPGQKPIILGH